MRVSNSMLSKSVVGNMSASLDRMLELQNQISSGKRISKATDDPVGAGRALNYRSALSAAEQYGMNIREGKSRLDQTDASLNALSKSLQSAKQITLSASAPGTVDRKMMVEQVQQTIDAVLTEINSRRLDRQLYSGGQTSTPSVSVNPSGAPPYVYNGDDGVMSVQVNDSTRIDVSLTAKQILNFDGAADPSRPDVLSVLTGLKEDLVSGTTEDLQTRMAQIDASFDHVVGLRGSVGLKSQQFELYANRTTDVAASLRESVSQEEDADLPQALTALQIEQNVYQASLLAASRSVQPSLADFLK